MLSSSENEENEEEEEDEEADEEEEEEDEAEEEEVNEILEEATVKEVGKIMEEATRKKEKIKKPKVDIKSVSRTFSPKSPLIKGRPIARSPSPPSKRMAFNKNEKPVASPKLVTPKNKQSAKSPRKPKSPAVTYPQQGIQGTPEEIKALKRNYNYVSKKFKFGQTRINILWCETPRPGYLTRQIDNDFLEKLKQSFLDHPEAYNMRQPLQINLAPKDEKKTRKEKCKNLLSEIKQNLDESKPTYDLLEKLRKYYFFETIGGNHTRTACQQILSMDSGAKIGDGQNHLFNAVLFLNLSVNQAKVVGVTDNMIKTMTSNYTPFEKISLVRDYWLERKNIKNPTEHEANWVLEQEAFEEIWKSIFYVPEKDSNLTEKQKLKRQQQRNPIIKGCHIPNFAWPVLSRMLKEKHINQTNLRNYNFWEDEGMLKEACDCFTVAMDDKMESKLITNLFKDLMNNIKYTCRVKPLILENYKKVDHGNPNATYASLDEEMKELGFSYAQFYNDGTIYPKMKSITKKQKKKISELSAPIKSLLEEKLKRAQNLKKLKENDFVYTLREEKETPHSLMVSPAVEVIDMIKDKAIFDASLDNYGLIFMILLLVF